MRDFSPTAFRMRRVRPLCQPSTTFNKLVPSSEESNLDRLVRSEQLYPLSYEGFVKRFILLIMENISFSNLPPFLLLFYTYHNLIYLSYVQSAH